MERFLQSRYRIHLSLDIWTAPSGNTSYLGVVAHWCDIDFKIQTVLIALRPLNDRHTGSNIAQCLIEIIDDYGIGDKVGYCMLDSASNNTTAIEELQPLLISKFGARAAIIDYEE